MSQTLGLLADIFGILGAIFALFSRIQARQLDELELPMAQDQRRVWLLSRVGLKPDRFVNHIFLGEKSARQSVDMRCHGYWIVGKR